MLVSFVVILAGWYFFIYRTSKEKYKKRWNKELKFKDTLNSKYWDKF